MVLPNTATTRAFPVSHGLWAAWIPNLWRNIPSSPTAVVLLLSLLILETGCVSLPRYRTNPPATNTPNKESKETTAPISTKGAYEVGMASYYAHKFHGRPTASGEIFDMNGISAAHRVLPLGTIIRVTHLGNGLSLQCKVNDRGPFVKNRVLDLSLGAAKKLKMVESGTAKIKIEIIKAVE